MKVLVIQENPYGRTLADGSQQVYCSDCGGWCDTRACGCSDCQAALLEYRESLQTDDVI
jgi:hypothetical protein